MNTNIPKSLKRPEPHILRIEWRDGTTSTVKLTDLRKECPCANCKGEEIAGKKTMPAFPMFSPGMNELKEIKQVGNYAIQPVWGDGHDTGIYTWDYLKELCDKFGV